MAAGVRLFFDFEMNLLHQTNSIRHVGIAGSYLASCSSEKQEKLLQLFLWKIVHFALFFVKISINFSPSYSTVFFITVDVSTLQKFQNFSIMF
jgi:hypothetical protein